MTNLANLTTNQLHRIISIKEKIEALQAEIDSIAGDGEIPTSAHVGTPKKRRMSRAGRAAIAAGARARWARVKSAKAEVAPKKRRKMSAAARAKFAAIARARWKKAKAAGKKTL